MHAQVIHPAGTKAVDAGILPDICAHTAVLPQPESVEVRCAAVLVDEDKFVLTSIERPLSSVAP